MTFLNYYFNFGLNKSLVRLLGITQGLEADKPLDGGDVPETYKALSDLK